MLPSHRQERLSEGPVLPPSAVLPDGPGDRARWVVARRPERNGLDPWRPYAFLSETEPGPDGTPWETATVFLTNRECPFRCVMCDLWRNTLEETVPPGALAAQVRHALERLPPARALKLYNAGSFFDPRAVPESEYETLAALAAPYQRVIVECHPAFLGERAVRFQDLLRASRDRLVQGPRAQEALLPHPGDQGPGTRDQGPLPVLEVAVGLETAHPGVLERLNKGMTLQDFRRAAAFLAEHGMALRVFLLVRPPWLTEAEGLEWARRSLDLAWECGAEVCSLIPTRGGNGAMEALAAAGEFAPPALASLEAAVEYGLAAGKGRVFADLWDVAPFARCPECAAARIDRLERMNRTQQVEPPVGCGRCGGSAGPRSAG